MAQHFGLREHETRFLALLQTADEDAHAISIDSATHDLLHDVRFGRAVALFETHQEAWEVVPGFAACFGHLVDGGVQEFEAVWYFGSSVYPLQGDFFAAQACGLRVFGKGLAVFGAEDELSLGFGEETRDKVFVAELIEGMIEVGIGSAEGRDMVV